MRQLTPVTNLLLSLAAAAALLPALSLPFFAVAEPYGSTGIERNGEQIGRWFTTPEDPVTGTETLGATRDILLGVAAVTALLCLLMAFGPLRRHLRDVIKVVPVAAPVLVALQLFDQPPGDVEVRWGLFATIAIAGFMASAAFHTSRLPLPKPPPKPYTPPAEPAGSQAPPGF